jgi:hypothetical protein
MINRSFASAKVHYIFIFAHFIPPLVALRKIKQPLLKIKQPFVKMKGCFVRTKGCFIFAKSRCD